MSEPKLPAEAEALNLLHDVGCHKGVIEHCKAVSRFAVRIAKAFKKKGVDVDVQLVKVGALLHDLGRSKTHTVNHGFIGGKIARALGLPRSVVRVIERHVGGGIPLQEAKQLGWPAKDYMPETWEEKIVCYADKRVQGLRTVPIEQTRKTYALSLGPNHLALNRINKLHDEIVAVVGEF